MGTAVFVKRTHFTVVDNMLYLFGEQAFTNGIGRCWAMTAFGSYDSCLYNVDPAPVKANIEAVIAADRLTCREQLIDHVRVDVPTALRLWCEGALMREHLTAAEETEDAVIVTMELGGQERRVVIKEVSEQGYPYATMDANGQIV